MKYFIIIGIFTLSHFTFSQTTQFGEPWSLTESSSQIRDITFLPDVDTSTLLEEDEWSGDNGPYRFGFEHLVNEDFFSNAEIIP